MSRPWNPRAPPIPSSRSSRIQVAPGSPNAWWTSDAVAPGGSMDLSKLKQVSESEWHIEPFGKMRVPGVVFATTELVRDMDRKVFEQLVNVASLPGIVKAAY